MALAQGILDAGGEISRMAGVNMRIIKFRAWIKGTSQIIYDGKPGDTLRWKHEGQNIVIMQYTGLNDKHGFPIYEGDIITHFGQNCAVEWYQEGAGFVVKYEEFGREKTDWISSDAEIIGNIYTSPVLADKDVCIKQAIIERVAKSCEAESDIKLIENVLDDAGFFELLEAANQAATEMIYERHIPNKIQTRLYDAIFKAKRGDTA